MTSLTSLAEGLLASAKKIDAELEANGIPYPSFDEDTLEKLPLEMQKMRWDLADASNHLRQLTRGAVLSTMDNAFNWTDALMMRIIWHYKLASAVPVDGTASYAEIAAISGLSTPLVFRTIRAAIGHNIFDEDDSGRVRHTAISRLMVTNKGFNDVIGHQIEDIGPASTQVISAWENYGHGTGEPAQSAFSMYNNSDQPFFTILAADPERVRRWNSAVQFLTSYEGSASHQVLRTFDWSTIDRPGARIVDVGGGTGQISQLIARKTQHVTFTVQDLPHVIAKASSQLLDDLKSRINLEEHNFMTPQPAENPPTAFLISKCIHNWSDKYAVQILQNLKPALRNGSKVLIIEFVPDQKPVKNLTDKSFLRLDFLMTTVANGQVRYAQDFERLLKLSDERFVMEKIHKPKEGKLSLIEVSWRV